MRKRCCFAAIRVMLALAAGGCANMNGKDKSTGASFCDRQFTVHPIGRVFREDDRTFIEIEPRYLPAMMGLDQLDEIVVLYWFDRNDTPEQRSTMQVHPRGDERNPLRGVFATHAPMRPNLIAVSRCRVLAVRGNVIEIDQIDAFDETPVIDIKSG